MMTTVEGASAEVGVKAEALVVLSISAEAAARGVLAEVIIKSAAALAVTALVTGTVIIAATTAVRTPRIAR